MDWAIEEPLRRTEGGCGAIAFAVASAATRSHDHLVRPLPGSLVALLVAVMAMADGCSTKACARNSDCASGDMCVFKIGSCSTEGECKAPPSGPQCGAIEELCGCNGEDAVTGCGFPDGYASGPTTGSSFAVCRDGGPAHEGIGADGAVIDGGS
jgi:hypothetical protein